MKKSAFSIINQHASDVFNSLLPAISTRRRIIEILSVKNKEVNETFAPFIAKLNPIHKKLLAMYSK